MKAEDYIKKIQKICGQFTKETTDKWMCEPCPLLKYDCGFCLDTPEEDLDKAIAEVVELVEHYKLPGEAETETEKKAERHMVTEEEITCPTCEKTAWHVKETIPMNGKAEHFVYCTNCMQETERVYSTKEKALQAFRDGKTESILGRY